MKGEQGFALVITLLVTALLVALTAEFTSEVFVDTSARHTFVAGQQASLLAESGITGGIKLLKLGRLNQSKYSSLNDQWAQPLKISDERGELQLVIEEESAKLNLTGFPPNGELTGNTAAEMAERLFRNLKLKNASDLVDSLADWIDDNDTPHPGGAENQYYSTLKPPYGAKNGPLDTVEELALVKGFAGEPLKALLPFVTAYKDSGLINVNTASRQVLMALDERITDEMADRVIEQRRTAPFENSADLTKVAGFETIGMGLLSTKITTKGNVYRLRSQGVVQGVTRTIEAVVSLNGPKQFLYWREYAPIEPAPRAAP